MQSISKLFVKGIDTLLSLALFFMIGCILIFLTYAGMFLPPELWFAHNQGSNTGNNLQTYTRPIEVSSFYGKVIDQHHTSVANAMIAYEIGRGYSSDIKNVQIAFTDQNGNFSISGDSEKDLYIDAIIHSNIEYKHKHKQPRRGKEQLILKGKQSYIVSGHKEDSWTDTSEDSPYIFNTRRHGEKFASSLVEGRESQVMSYGDIYTINFSNPSGDRIQKSVNNGDIRISFDLVGEGEQWIGSIAPIDGGIIETEDVYLQEAPEDGYLEYIQLSGKKNRHGRFSSLKARKYYFHSHDKKLYGALIMKLSPHNSLWVETSTEFIINDNGENILIKGNNN